MPTGLTIFAAQYLVFVAVLLAAAVVAVRLWPRPRPVLVHWVCAAVLLLVLSYVLARIGGALYNDPRPFTTSPVPPLVAHTPDNGFPSDHGLLAAALVALVAIVDLAWALPFVLLAVLIDWARVVAGLHHVIDGLGSAVFVALATLVALLVAPIVVRWLAPYLPAGWREQRVERAHER